jgi:hypothetical protein
VINAPEPTVAVEPSQAVAPKVILMPHSTSLDLSGHLHRVYLGVRVDAEKLSGIDHAGQLEARVKVYSDLAVIARELGAGKVVDLIGKDVQGIRAYVAGDKTRAWEQEGVRIKEELRVLDAVVAVLAHQPQQSKLEQTAQTSQSANVGDAPVTSDVVPGPASANRASVSDSAVQKDGYGSIIYDNLRFLLGGEPEEGKQYPKLVLKQATGFNSPGGLSGIVGTLQKNGLIHAGDYGMSRGSINFTYSRLLIDSIGGAMKRLKPPILKTA